MERDDEVPEGVEKLFLRLEHQRHFHTIIGEDVTVQDPFVLLPKAALEDQLDSIVFAFDPLLKKVANYDGEEMLLVYDDNDDGDGHNFLLCVTEEAKENMLGRAGPGPGGSASRADRAAGEAADPGAAGGQGGGPGPDRRTASVFISAAPGEVEAEIAAGSAKPTRPLLKLAISRPRKFFGAPYKLGDREAHDGMEECRPYKDPNFSVVRLEADVGFQAVRRTAESGLQTGWSKPENAATQWEAQTMESAAAAKHLDDDALAAALGEKAALFEFALQQNNAVNVYADNFAALVDEDAVLGRESESLLVETHSCSDAQLIGDALLTSADWQPGRRDVLAVAVAAKASFDERAAESNVNKPPSLVAVWNLSVTIHSHPVLLLQAPADVRVVRFCPSQPHILAGGLVTGQVVIWDIAEAQAAVESSHLSGSGSAGPALGASAATAVLPDVLQAKATPAASRPGTQGGSGSAGTAGASAAADIPVVSFCLLSTIESSHKRPVTDIVWMPPQFEVNSSGTVNEDETVLSHQFVSSSYDGAVVFWDIHSRKDLVSERAWRPLHRIRLHKVSRMGDHGPIKVAVDPLRAQLTAITEDGELVFADWRINRSEQKRQVVRANFYGAPGFGAAIAPHPVLPSIILTASDWCTQIWTEAESKPLITSPATPAVITDAVWSPSRAGVFYIARADGCIEVWDLLEKSHGPSRIENITSSTAITSVAILTVPHKKRKRKAVKQLLAITDDSGFVRVVAIPRSLVKGPAQEAEFVGKLFERERERLVYFADVMIPHRDELALAERASADARAKAAAMAAMDADEDAKEKVAELQYQKFQANFERELEMMAGGAP
ncbi:WD repeat protein 63 [Thecamonas trahens ATCC 50062]|uniref:WD repeat protein 63 n=1 Tax=Thecamonas trahens ATCC 50062 TaxID=461836 RepID=A0A0L0DA16_THETB|nr:WD repeat protein 63 [Thecamonas trahens ATCC 50062]KNC48936.1 WD repeat protein 63 [Thecamonas trahens ATCC 50062]|eukprot:XP_013758353.1 WD repeat protein 63 [Thecamonas trahens ATCC 50062]